MWLIKLLKALVKMLQTKIYKYQEIVKLLYKIILSLQEVQVEIILQEILEIRNGKLIKFQFTIHDLNY